MDFDLPKHWTTILLDIEGTTTSISFVKEVLFPYAAQNVQKFLEENWLDPEVQDIVTELRKQCEIDIANQLTGVERIIELSAESTLKDVQESVVVNILWQIKLDRKTTGLKSLQGKIWNLGFQTGQLHGHVYEDVPEAFQRLVDNKKKICIYSSGSVEAQKLLFKYSIAGDLGKFISGYFDTKVGGKGESQSYTNIASSLNVDPREILFVTDIPNEAVSAQEASMKTVLMVRPGNTPLSEEHIQKFLTVNNFAKFS